MTQNPTGGRRSGTISSVDDEDDEIGARPPEKRKRDSDATELNLDE